MIKSETATEELDWGKLTWLSRPQATGSEHLTVIHVELCLLYTSPSPRD